MYSLLHVARIEVAVVGTCESLCRGFVHINIGIIGGDGIDVL